MSSVPGVDRPAEQAEAEIALSGRGISVSSRVELVEGDVVVVRPSVGEYVDQAVVEPGTTVAVFWHNAEGQRTMPAEVVRVDQGAVVRWRLHATGPAEHSQRRRAVRARVVVPVAATCAGVELTGQTLDLSEAGLRANFDGHGLPPDTGDRIDLVVSLEDGVIRTKAEVVRTHLRGSIWRMSIQFGALPEREQDRIRRRVFQALREERARLAEASSRR